MMNCVYSFPQKILTSFGRPTLTNSKNPIRRNVALSRYCTSIKSMVLELEAETIEDMVSVQLFR